MAGGLPEDENGPWAWLRPVCNERFPASVYEVIFGMLTATGRAEYLQAPVPTYQEKATRLIIEGRNSLAGGGQQRITMANTGQVPDATGRITEPVGRRNLFVNRQAINTGLYAVKVPESAVPLIQYGEIDSVEHGQYGLAWLQCSDDGPIGGPWLFPVIDMGQFIERTGRRGFFGPLPSMGLQEGRRLTQWVQQTPSGDLWTKAFTPVEPRYLGGLLAEEFEVRRYLAFQRCIPRCSFYAVGR